MQTQALSCYSMFLEEVGTPLEISKNILVVFFFACLFLFQLGLSNHCLLLRQDLRQGPANNFKEELSSLLLEMLSTQFINHKFSTCSHKHSN